MLSRAVDIVSTLSSLRSNSNNNKLALKKYEAIHNLVGKVVQWELCKKLKFDHLTKSCMHKPEFILGNEMYEIYKTILYANKSPDSSQKTRPDRKKRKLTVLGCLWTIEWKSKKIEKKYTLPKNRVRCGTGIWRQYHLWLTPLEPESKTWKNTEWVAIQGTNRNYTDYHIRSVRILSRVLKTWWDLVPLGFLWNTTC